MRDFTLKKEKRIANADTQLRGERLEVRGERLV